MVKNTKGGSGHKSQARKFASGSGKITNKATRFSQDEYEYYAQVVATLGNGMCHVMCKDGKKRLCHIRGKFRGRGMRDNMVKNGVWVLVGGRDFEAERTKDDKKLENCDLLEVYSDLDKERLKTLGGFSEFIARDHTFTNTSEQADDFLEFTDNATEDEYFNIMKKQGDSSPSSNKVLMVAIIEDEEINVDDI
jgi:translation initiation factor 1A